MAEYFRGRFNNPSPLYGLGFLCPSPVGEFVTSRFAKEFAKELVRRAYTVVIMKSIFLFVYFLRRTVSVFTTAKLNMHEYVLAHALKLPTSAYSDLTMKSPIGISAPCIS